MLTSAGRHFVSPEPAPQNPSSTSKDTIMQGFKEFIMRGNLVELAVAFIMGAVFATVVESFTKIIMDFIAKAGGAPDLTGITLAGVEVGTFLTALLTFILTALVVYFFVVLPYNKAKERFVKDDPAVATTEELLADIRDILASDRGTGGAHVADGEPRI